MRATYRYGRNLPRLRAKRQMPTSMPPSLSFEKLPDMLTDYLYSALSEVQSLLKRFIEIKDKASEMYKKNLSLALLETTFRLPVTTLNPNHDSTGLSPRVVQIGLFLDQYFERLAAFDDIKGYVAELGFEEAKALMQSVVPRMLDEVCLDCTVDELVKELTGRAEV